MQDEDSAAIMSTEELAHYVERGRLGVERNRITLDAIAQKLAMREGEIAKPGDLLASARFNYLKNMMREELVVLQQSTQQQLKRYEDALRIATAARGERRQYTNLITDSWLRRSLRPRAESESVPLSASAAFDRDGGCQGDKMPSAPVPCHGRR
jgi:hypothetical protein